MAALGGGKRLTTWKVLAGRAASIALVATVACSGAALKRPLAWLESDPLPESQRTLRIQGFSGSHGPVLRLEARGSRVKGELVQSERSQDAVSGDGFGAARI
ncbi:MAG TPA: hypothetical protein VJ717_07220 [Gemmatimonadaceae bacterium]|nr:hypothetical protein [Gemmatimonadaceae bacterium]